MVLSGDGGDENFAGYGSYAAWMRWMHPLNKPLWRRTARFFAQYIAPQKYPRSKPSLESWLRLVSYLDAKQRLCLWRDEFKHLPEQHLDIFEKEYLKASAYSLCSRVQYLDIKTYLPFDILTKVDIASMMHGLETRTPIVDIHVVEFAATIPQSINIKPLKNGDWQGKLILKKLLGQYFPAEFINRGKKGFAVPLKKWFSPGGALRTELKDRLLGDTSMLYEFFNPTQVNNLIDENNTGPLWLLFFLEEWLHQNRAGVVW
jgi:asparagine synthase (glutamine-hydrolysing)